MPVDRVRDRWHVDFLESIKETCFHKHLTSFSHDVTANGHTISVLKARAFIYHNIGLAVSSDTRTLGVPVTQYIDDRHVRQLFTSLLHANLPPWSQDGVVVKRSPLTSEVRVSNPSRLM